MAKKKSRKRKGQLQALPGAALSVGLLAMIVAVVAIVLVAFNGSTTVEAANTVIGDAITAMGTFGDWFSTIVIIVIAVVVLGLVMGFFMYRRASGKGSA